MNTVSLVVLLVILEESMGAPKKDEKCKYKDNTVPRNTDLEFDRLKRRQLYLDDDIITQQLAKSDPFLSDFVPLEYTDYGFGMFHHHNPLFKHQLNLKKRPQRFRRFANHVLQAPRQQRDVDSNSISDRMIKSPRAQPTKLLLPARLDNVTLHPVEPIPDKTSAEDSSENEILTNSFGADTSTTSTSVEAITVPSTTAAATSTTSASSPTSSLATSTLPHVPSREPSENNEVEVNSKSEKISWIQSQINGLMNEDLSSSDRDLLLHLNETLTTSNMDRLFYLTVDFMKLRNRIQEAKEISTQRPGSDGQQSKAKKASLALEEYERKAFSADASNDLSCKNLNKYKIMPKDSKEVVRAKYATQMKCYMDQSVDPCEDFYSYACGRWAEFHPIPKDKSGYDTFEILREHLHSNLISIFEEEITNEDSNATASAKLLYNSCMNLDKIEQRKEKPLLDLLDRLGGWPVLEGNDWNAGNFNWIDTVTQLRLFNNDILIAIWIGPDGKDSDEFILQLDQSDLMLPSTDYYKLGFSHPIIQTYYNLLIDVANLLGADQDRARKEMKSLIEFETEVAHIMVSPILRRNFSEIYKKMPLMELQARVSGFNFSKYLDTILPRKLNDTEEVVVYALPYFQKLIKLIEATDKRTVANYILWRFIRHRLNNLDHRFEDVQQSLYRMLYGREETPPREKFCVSYVNGNLGNVVGNLFVQRFFDRQSKLDMEALTREVQGVFRDLVQESDWLSNETKDLAEHKIDNIVHNIGYPDAITDEEKLNKEMEGLYYHEDKFFENVLMNLRARTQSEMSQLDERVNRTLWTTTPAVVNAYYSRNRNQIMFPAAILQPPFYHKYFPKALNYGGIGIVIGHEITHGFDDKGRQFDSKGNIEQWWDITSFKNFRDRKQCIIDQYDKYVVEEVGINVSGENTQGENIADNGGIKQAYLAYRNWLSRNNKVEESPMPGLESLSGDQLFFLNFAQVWCGHTRPEALRSKLKTAVHAPGAYRVLGTLSNSEYFAQAYSCPRGSKMNPSEKCSVW